MNLTQSYVAHFIPFYFSPQIDIDPITQIARAKEEGKVVLVDYTAAWCGPCKMIAPILDTIATQYKDKLRVVKLNIDENPKTPPKFNIRGIPTLLLFRNGTVAAQQVGAVSKAQLESFLETHLNANAAQFKRS